ncbi:phage holin family protein [Candidatus Methylospira mobilis]|uniref:Phage holin family protein n=1 Tax=Candidatus Methylospira mobilis TaxID=1808979 RepID=A0A5Q0BR11_9GAMM|nr:phage holin family protein [Candidatus Methylospira mobilis]QFY44517.1 phage holin family protein [Candidatus Methylospira mobilis]
MPTKDAPESETSGDSAHGDPVDESSVLDDVRSLLHDLRGLTHDCFHLVALETRRAGESLVGMIVAGVMVAVLLSGAWLGLVAAAVLELVDNGVKAGSAMLLAVALNLLLALILCGLIRRKSRYLQFPATLRSLHPPPSSRRNAEKT